MNVEHFHGSYEYGIDGKGRLILPSRLRGPFETKKAVVSCYVDRCLALWTPEEFTRYLSRAEEMEAHGSEGRNLARALSALSAEVELDGQWRVTIPGNLRDYADLELDRPVMVVGVLNRIELWRADLWRQRMAPSLQSLADGTSALFSNGPAPVAQRAGASGAGDLP